MSIAEKLTTVAENVSKVYEAGKKSEYDDFWDRYQINGTRTSYSYAFAGEGWGAINFKPKYTIKPKNAQYMFAQMQTSAWEDVSLDTSNMTGCPYMFQSYTGTRIPPINISKLRQIIRVSICLQLVLIL